MTDARWKRVERQAAAMLGSRRNSNNGERRTDIDAGPFAVEAQVPPDLATGRATTGEKGRRRTDAYPRWVLTEVRQGVKAKRYVLLDFQDWADWHGDPAEKAFA